MLSYESLMTQNISIRGKNGINYLNNEEKIEKKNKMN